MHQQMKHIMERLPFAETKVRDGVNEELRETKKVAEQANLKVNETPSPRNSRKIADIDTELNKMKSSLDTASQEIRNKENEIKSLKAELEKVKDFEVMLAEKKACLSKLENELRNGKESEKKMLGLLGEQTKQLEQTKILLEESKVEIISLREKLEKSEGQKSDDHICVEGSMREEIESLISELKSTKENLARAQEAAEVSSVKVSNLLEEMSLVKNELNLATEAEVTSKKAMDDFALALKEVAMDCSQVKEKLVITEVQLEAARLETREWKEKLESTEENYKTLLQEARKEAELHKNTTERLRLEAEESLLAWNGKEAVFVNCIKRGEGEKNSLLEENNRLLQALVTAENLSKKAKDENHKLRDILKQAINEANVAKEAAGIARAENSQLKDALLEKEEAVEFLSRENEHLKVNEAAAYENIKELKRLLSEASMANDSRLGAKGKGEVLSHLNSMEIEQGKNLSHQNSMEKDKKTEKKNDKKEQQKDKKEDKKEQGNEENEDKKEQQKEQKENDKEEQQSERKEHQQNEKKLGKTCSFSLRELKIPNKHKDIEEETKAPIHQYETEESEDSPGSASDLFKGSIFDVAETPDAVTTHHRKKSSCTFAEDGETINSEELEHLEGNHLDDGESDKSSRKKKAFIRRFGDLLVRRKSFHKKELSAEQQEQPQQQQQSSEQLQN